MSEITTALMKKIAPTVSAELREEYTRWLNVYLPMYDITTELRLGMFFANFMAESGRFTRLEENLNYSANRLMQVWPKRFPTFAKAQAYAGQPRKLANYVYGGRNGNTSADDGWIYRGGGLGQTTGKGNYKETGSHMGLDLVAHPQLLRVPRYAVWSACVEWSRRGCNELADQRQLRRTRQKINGGFNGMADVETFYAQVMRWLPDGFILSSTISEPRAVEASTFPDEALKEGGVDRYKSHIPDTAFAEDTGTPSDLPENEGSEGVEVVGSGSEGKNASEGQQTPANATIQLTKESPSLFVKWMTAIKVAIGTAIAGLSSYCGGSEIQTQLTSKAIDNVDPSWIPRIVVILVFILIGVGAGVLLIWIASLFYDRSGRRATQLNAQKINQDGVIELVDSNFSTQTIDAPTVNVQAETVEVNTDTGG